MKSETKLTPLFLALAFSISWVFMFGMVLLDLNINSPITLLFSTLSVLGPGIAALIMLLKKMSFKEYLKYIFTFEQRFSYYAIFVVWAVWRYLLCMMVGVRVEGSSLILPLIMIPVCILTGGNEELGWRFLQTQMEKKMHSVLAALIYTVIWALWHLPLWFVPWDWRNTVFDFFIFLGLSLTNAFSLAAIFKLTNSVLLCVLAHAWMNAVFQTFSHAGDLKGIVGFCIEAIIGMIILILCDKGIIKSAKTRI